LTASRAEASAASDRLRSGNAAQSRRDQKRILLTERHLQPLGEAQHHLPARSRAAGLDEAQMPRRDLGLEGEIELAHAPPLAPAAQMMSDRTDFLGHGEDIVRAGRRVHYLRRNRPAPFGTAWSGQERQRRRS
jgi:hypothetical protein